VVAVTVVAAVGLYSMRTLTSVSADSIVGSEVEKTIESYLKGDAPGEPALDASLITEQHDLLASLHNDYTEIQVPLDNIQRDPFIIFETRRPDPLAGDDDVPAPSNNRFEQERQQRRAAIVTAGERLRLKSVILGSAPLANVGGRIVRLGDTIEIEDDGIAFTVIEITRTAIALEARDDDYNLIVAVSINLDQS
jgi:hypothetical protein